MEPLISQASLRSLLERGISNGWWTKEQLDTPPPGYSSLWADNKGHYVAYRVPQRPYTNPLREG
jgi:hypothetical protein